MGTQRYLTKGYRMQLSGKRVTVVGLGREGIALVHYLSEQGAQITISDNKTEFELAPFLAQIQGISARLSPGRHAPEDFRHADIIFISAGIPTDLPQLVEARQLGIPISSITQLFFELCPAPIIGITGSSGKTTTTTLIGEFLKAQGGRQVIVGGNIGRTVLGDLPQITPDSIIVLEMSFNQLEIMTQSPHIALLLNITPNHLDRCRTMEVYAECKRQILYHQRPEDFAILNPDNPLSAESRTGTPGKVLWFSRHHPVEVGAFLEDGWYVFRDFDGRQTRICRADQTIIPGNHNHENVLAAIAATHLVGVRPEAMTQVISSFPGVAHRLQYVAEVNGVRYINDSIATAPERMMAALKVYEQQRQPLVLIAGGRDKHLPWEECAERIVRQVHALVLLGEATELIADAISAARERVPVGEQTLQQVYRATSMADAVHGAAALARPGDVVLLSPGGTSFDLFVDFADRGEQFAREVQRLRES
jgi:UDP-N-acetylmuramoylalanine--D-glutamate ligase